MVINQMPLMNRQMLKKKKKIQMNIKKTFKIPNNIQMKISVIKIKMLSKIIQK